MNRNKRPVKRYSAIKTILSVIAIVAFVAIIMLVVHHFNNAPKSRMIAVQKGKEAPAGEPDAKVKEVIKDTVEPVAEDGSKTQIKTTPEQIAANDTGKTIKTVVQKNKPIVKAKRLEDTLSIQSLTFEETEKAERVSDEQMAQILNDINTEKAQLSTASKCVTVRIVNSRNADNGFKIANYLRRNGFVISGREVVKGTQKGIQIDAAGPCIKLVIGNL